MKPYFNDNENIFLFSTDFCHWGGNYTFKPFKDKVPEIWKHIEKMDREGIDFLFSKNIKGFT